MPAGTGENAAVLAGTGENVAVLVVMEEMEAEARRVIDPDALDFISCGSGDEISVGEAAAAWSSHRLRPHALRDVSAVDTATTVLSHAVRSPVLVAPSAFHTLVHPDGEVATAAGVAAAGSLLVLSMRAGRRLEEAAAACGGPWWLQVYVMRDRRLTEGLVDRAVAAGATALVLTADTPVLGSRRRPTGRAGISDADYLVNLGQHATPGLDPIELSVQDPSQGAESIEWLRNRSGLPVLVKGVLRGDDAAAFVEAGAAGIIVSNHGGRQLDRAVTTAQALPEVVAAVGDRVDVLVDGGVRDGTTVLTALALGARAVLLGRPIYWALATDGARGVERLLGAMTEDLAHVMALAGVTSAQEVPADLVVPA